MSGPKILRDYQQSGKEFMLNFERVILADDPGVGKTLQALSALDELLLRDHYKSSISKNIFIVCPASAKRQWVLEIMEFPRLKELLQQDFSPIHICTWDHLATVIQRTQVDTIYCVILDEAHKVKNYTTARHKAAKKLTSRARYRWMLTGTPIDRRPAELLNLLAIAGRLAAFGGFWPFALRYCEAHKSEITGGWDFSGAANLEELGQILRDANILIRRTATDVLSLPPLTIEATYHQLSRADVALYTNGAGPGERTEPNLLHEGNDDQVFAGQLASMRSLLGDLKTTEAARLATEVWAITNKPVIVFAHHQHVVHEIAWQLQCSYIAGNITPKKRAEAIDSFLAGKTHRPYLVLSLSLAAEALDGLQHVASDMIIAELPWTASALRQAIGRLWRYGQKHPVTVYPLIAEGTIDELIFNLITKKTETSYTLFDTEEADRTQLEVMQAIRERLAA